MFDLTEPTSSGRAAECALPYVACSALASIGSPTVVPVPCASTTATSPAPRPASARARQITFCCAAPLGADSPSEAPSWPTALPRISAITGYPRLRAHDSVANTSTPAPSATPNPSAAAANGLHRPSSASARCRPRPTRMLGEHTTVAPPTTAKPHSSDRNDCIARCTATRDDEQDVSTVTAGPSSPSV